MNFCEHVRNMIYLLKNKIYIEYYKFNFLANQSFFFEEKGLAKIIIYYNFLNLIINNRVNRLEMKIFLKECIVQINAGIPHIQNVVVTLNISQWFLACFLFARFTSTCYKIDLYKSDVI